MQKKKRNKENSFRMHKHTAKSQNYHFKEIFSTPFTVGSTNPLNNSNHLGEVFESSMRICLNNGTIIGKIYDKETDPEKSKIKIKTLTELVVKILNGEEIKLKLKNVRFNCDKDMDGEILYINQDPFMGVITESSVKTFMERAPILTTYKSPKTIRRSLMLYIMRKLNESIE